MSYTYKGTDISKLIVSGSSSITSYSGFPSYKPASTYSTERPLPFGISQSNVSVSNLMDASYIDLTGSGTYTVPTDFNVFRAVLEGGGGGGGGGAGCGVNGGPVPNTRKPANAGASGANGGFVYISDTPITNRNIIYNVGTAGSGGNGGSSKGKTDQATPQPTNPGNDGSPGNTSVITFDTNSGTYTVTANAGTGGQGGDATNPATNTTPAVTQTTINYQQTSLFNTDGNQQSTVIPTQINPISYVTTYSNGGGGGPETNAGQAGQAGYIRIYLLKN
jgi:hypothetical protein